MRKSKGLSGNALLPSSCCDPRHPAPADWTLARRSFLQAGCASLAAASIPSGLFAAPSPKSTAETVVAELYASLTDAQKKEICHDFADPKRDRVNANWHVTKPLIDNEFYSDTQRAMIEKIVRNVTSEEGFKRLTDQMEYDDGGLGAYSIALFGKPGEGSFEWMLTGRHLTLRADGNTLDKQAFGGPIVYGHGMEGEPKDNIFFYQTQVVNELFKALDPAQAAKALLDKAPAENAVTPQGAKGTFPGLAVAEMTADQKGLVDKTLKTILGPYRSEDADESLDIIKAGGGVDALRFAFYKQGDMQNDQVWDIWRIEGPNSVCHFRGAPHVHAYIHIAEVG
jgi:hypothetical protein